MINTKSYFNKGFTLVETIIYIALLSFILFSFLNNTRFIGDRIFSIIREIDKYYENKKY